MIFKIDLRKISEQVSELTARGLKLSARVGLPIALGISTLGCGKNSRPGSTIPQEDSRAPSAQGIFRGDALRTGLQIVFRRVRPSEIPTMPQTFEILDRVRMEVLDRVKEISEGKDKIEVEHMEKITQGRPVFSSEWLLTEKLKPYFFSTVDEVKEFCAKAAGRMEKVATVAGELDACKVTKRFAMAFRNSQGESFMKSGMGERWMAAVPFGWIKAEWKSDKQTPSDVEVVISQQILSYRRNGKGFPQSNHEHQAGWTLGECENQADGNIQPNP